VTRDEVFDELQRMGVGEVRVGYHGGGDEGFVDHYEFYAPNGTELEIPGGRFSEEFEDAIEQPLYDELGEGFGDGEPHVDGEVVWKVAERIVLIEHSYQEWVDAPAKEI
jgi:hypothetical protein